METLHAIFAHVCGQVNLWSPGGETLPFCQRCTGLYLGGAWAMLAWLLARPRPTRRMLALHVAMLLLMVPFGYHWVEQGAVVRTLTGYLFAFGMVYFLALHPAHRLGRDTGASRDALYWLLLALGAPALLLALRFGGARTAHLLAALGTLGLAAYGALAAVTLLSLLPLGRGQRSRAGNSTEQRANLRLV